MNTKPLSQAKSPDLRGSLAALQRAAQAAREQAKQLNSFIVVQKNGEMVKQRVK